MYETLPMWFFVPAVIILWGAVFYIWNRDRRKKD